MARSAWKTKMREIGRKGLGFGPLVWWVLASFLLVGGAGYTRTPAFFHMILAMAVFPLIVAAMLYFVPVLTRSRPVMGGMAWLPIPAAIAGFLAATAIQHAPWLIGVAVPMAIGVCLLLLWWLWQRGRGCLGPVHAGFFWYPAAVSFLLLGLTAALGIYRWPEYGFALHEFHRHVNLLGFVGLTAMGTLPVLLPTVAGLPAPQVAVWLRRYLPWVILGTGGLALGATGLGDPWLVWVGRGFWFWPLSVLGWSWWQIRGSLWAAPGSALSLVAAWAGFFVVVAAGTPVETPLFFSAFLFPLVTGALSHLLPLWWWPGGDAGVRLQAQRFLGWGGALRGGMFFMAGLAQGSGVENAEKISFALVAWFMVQALAARWKFRRPHTPSG